MIYKPGDLPDCKYASESLMPRVIGCTQVYLRLRWFYLCVESCRCDNSFCLYRKFLKMSEIVYNGLEIKIGITKERRGLRHDVVYVVFVSV